MKLTKDQKSRLDALEERRKAAFAKIDEAVETANEALSRAFGPVEAAINNYNEIVAEFNDGLRTDIESDLEDFISDKSEKWQEGERGQAVSEMHTQWQEEAAEISVPEEPKIEIEFGDATENDVFTDSDVYPQEPSA